ncbi:MAG: STAS domain-containing protein [Mycobacteriales bacterium]|nr:STAS domain-containing protein [Actinomycetota bacterium]
MLASHSPVEDAAAFGIRLSRLNGHARLAAFGDIDVVSAPQLREALALLIDNHVQRLLVDLSEVTFIDSAGLEALLAAQRQLVANGGGLEIVACTRWVLRLLRVTELDRYLLAP